MLDGGVETLTDRVRSYTPSPDWVGGPTALASSPTVRHWPPGPWPEARHEVSFEVSRATWESEWFDHVLTRLWNLLDLTPNWNGYGEREVHLASAKRLVALLDSIDYADEAPAIVPLSDGSLQLEWHRGGRSLEVEVPSTGPAIGWLSGPDLDEEWMVSTPAGLQVLRQRVRLLLDS